MPTFEFTSPEGKSYSVDGPDGATPAQAFAILNQHLGVSAPEVSTAGDVAKSAGIGVAKGAIGLAGLPDDITELGARGIDYATRKVGGMLGVDVKPRAPQEPKFGAAQIQNAVEGATGKFYEPQTTAGKYAQSVGEFVPAMIGGPESLAAKFATRAAIPGIASEAAGQLTGDNPYAKAAGAIVGGVGSGVALGRLTRPAATAVPAAEDILKTAGDQFKAADNLNVTVKPHVPQTIATDIRDKLRTFDPESQKPVFNAVDALEGLGKSGAPVAMNDMEIIRKRLVNAKTSTDPATREAARKAIDILNDGKTSLKSADVISGDAAAYNQLNRDAVANWAAGKRSNTVMGKANLGELNAQTAGSGANEDNALRQAIKQLARPVNNDITPKWQRMGFNAAEGAAINSVARGTVLGNTARYLGKAAPTGSVSAVLSMGAGHAAGGPLGAVMLPAAGYIAKKIGDLSTKKGIAALDSLVRSRSPHAAEVAAAHPKLVQKLPSSTQRLLLALTGVGASRQIPMPVAQSAPGASQ